uniref:Uncharacterized protein n=1 Tax=Anopheles merus TaxID=30066 RepID=A0A182VN46_ANOME
MADPTSCITFAAGLFWFEACVYGLHSATGPEPAGPAPVALGTKNGLRWWVMVSWADSVTSRMADAIRLRWYRAIISRDAHRLRQAEQRRDDPAGTERYQDLLRGAQKMAEGREGEEG